MAESSGDTPKEETTASDEPAPAEKSGDNPDTKKKENKKEEDVTCCPPGSVGPAVVTADRPLQGKMTEIPPPSGIVGMLPLPCYCTGTPFDKAQRVVVVFTDVYGIDAGHHKVFADCLAETLDPTQKTTVIVPDLFRGVPIMQPWLDNSSMTKDVMGSLLGAPGMIFRLRQYPPQKVEQEIFQMILPFIQSQTSEDVEVQLSCVGFCFGGWVVGRVLGHQHQAGDSPLTFQCGVGIHPSFQPNLLHAETQTTMADRIHKPILLLPAWNDVDLKPNTPLVNLIQSNLAAKKRKELQNEDDGEEEEEVGHEEIAIEFPNMIHGWVSRGDPTNLEIAAEQQRALQLTVDFIQKHTGTGTGTAAK